MSQVMTTPPLEFVETVPLPHQQTESITKPSLPAAQPLPAESEFYNRYEWSLNPFQTVAQVIRRLLEQLDWLENSDPGWQQEEIYRNVYLLSCAIFESVDDYLLGPKYEFSKISAAIPLTGSAVTIAESMCRRGQHVSAKILRELAGWREQWQTALIRVLKLFVTKCPLDKASSADFRSTLSMLATEKSFGKLREKRIRIPGAFRSQDLTHFDFLALGRKFVDAYPERQRPVLVLGLRTAGSYVAPLLHAFLETENYCDVESITLRPKLGVSKIEAESLARCHAKGSRLLIVDEPVGTGSTFLKTVEVARKFSVPLENIVILTPLHSEFSHLWKANTGYCLFANLSVLTLPPEEWSKCDRLDAETEEFLKEYFRAQNVWVKSIDANSQQAREFNQHLESVSDKKGHTRNKRVYEINLVTDLGDQVTRYVLAKGVGWGWFSYHAFLAGERLAQFITPMLGLRNGILYTEWKPKGSTRVAEVDRDLCIERLASYIAARARTLRLDADPATALILEHRNNGLANLTSNLCRAYGPRPAPFFSRGRIAHELSRLQTPYPSLIDGQMRPSEWIGGNSVPLKSDFEHHGLGKTEINMTDPAFDLADTILSWQLSFDEETRLVRRYIEESGDASVADRLLVNKLIAGIRALGSAGVSLGDPRLIRRHEEFNRTYIAAWNFLVLHTMRYCAELCSKPDKLSWHGPLVALDVDGVLDKQIIGFPSASWAGIQAISYLHAHDVAVVLNTARSIPEVKEYCKHYGFLGGVAEYGAYAWDAITNQEKVLVSQESLKELKILSEELRRIPGIFLNEDYLYSIRAYTFDGETTKAVPRPLIQNLMARLKLDRLTFHQTYIDTAVLAKETDKGKGLLALLDLAGQRHLLGAAVGDSEADLPMFAVAKSSFAPGHISCRSQARAVGCYVDAKPFQPGLLNIVRRIVHPNSDTCPRCPSAEPPEKASKGLVFEALRHADESRVKRLARAVFHPMLIRSFVAN